MVAAGSATGPTADLITKYYSLLNSGLIPAGTEEGFDKDSDIKSAQSATFGSGDGGKGFTNCHTPDSGKDSNPCCYSMLQMFLGAGGLMVLGLLMGYLLTYKKSQDATDDGTTSNP